MVGRGGEERLSRVILGVAGSRLKQFTSVALLFVSSVLNKIFPL